MRIILYFENAQEFKGRERKREKGEMVEGSLAALATKNIQ